MTYSIIDCGASCLFYSFNDSGRAGICVTEENKFMAIRRVRLYIGTTALAFAVVASVASAASTPQADPGRSAESTGESDAMAQLEKAYAKYERDPQGNVTGVILSGGSVSNNTLALLSAFPRLNKVEIHCAKYLTDDGLAPLEKLSGLRTLILAAVPVTDQGMRHVAKLSNLTYLSVAPCWADFKDAGLEYLKGLKNLRTVRIEGQVKIGAEAAKSLRGALPDCTIRISKSRD
jgi:hypothetical protein